MSPESRIKALRGAPPNGWAAFSADESKLVAYGLTYEDAVAKAEKEGEKDPVLVKVPDDWTERVLAQRSFLARFGLSLNRTPPPRMSAPSNGRAHGGLENKQTEFVIDEAANL